MSNLVTGNRELYLGFKKLPYDNFTRKLQLPNLIPIVMSDIQTEAQYKGVDPLTLCDEYGVDRNDFHLWKTHQ
jgi:hypothetical protein